MILFFVFVFVALGFSFLCSIAESVLLSVTIPYARNLEEEGKPYGRLLRQLREDVGSSLAAILTLNTVAHTVGAAGAGAQAAVAFGDASLGVVSAILTLLILVLSEIIPKSLGAAYWRRLAPAVAYFLRGLIFALYPFVVLSNAMTRRLEGEQKLHGLNREEVTTMAELGEVEGQLHPRESSIIQNLIRTGDLRSTDAMTPRPVVFRVPESMTVGTFFREHGDRPFSRVPTYVEGDADQVTGFVLRSEVLFAQAKGESDRPLTELRRPLEAGPDLMPLWEAFERLTSERSHMLQLVDEYGSFAGILTLEDVLETMIGLEIVDEVDVTVDMQSEARKLWRRRARKMGLDAGEEAEKQEPGSGAGSGTR